LATGSKTAPTMLNGWTNYNSSIFYWLDGQGYGHIVGEVRDAGAATLAAGTTLFTLPFGTLYRFYFPMRTATVRSGTCWSTRRAM
jgi:hypothetical protein